MSKTAFAIVAHPDDIEFLMAGTLMRLKDAGYELHYMNVANGCCGSATLPAEEIAAIRREESIAAAKTLGATFHESLCNDLEIFYDKPTLLQLTSIVRRVAPDIVLTHSPADYMEDHMNTCRLAVTAAFARGMPNFVTDPPAKAIDKPVAVYHAQPYSNCDPLCRPVVPEIFVDTSDLIERKQKQLACHASQKEWLDVSQGQDSYLKTLAELDREVGILSGRFAAAEGWRQHLHYGFGAAGYNPLLNELPKNHVVKSQSTD